MQIKKLKTQKRYLIAAIVGVIMIILVTFSFIESYKQNDNSKKIIRGLSLVFWIVYTISFAVFYRKESRSGSN
jgi:hypothetical protein